VFDFFFFIFFSIEDYYKLFLSNTVA